MTIESGLVLKVKADVDVVALIGGRFFPVVLPQDVEYPAATFQPIGGESGYSLGTQAAQTRNPRFQINAWDPTAEKALEVARAIRDALDHKSGLWDDVAVTGAIFDGEPLVIYHEKEKIFQAILELMANY